MQDEVIEKDNAEAPEVLDALDAVSETEAGDPVDDISSVEDTPVYSPENHLTRVVELLEGILARTGTAPAETNEVENDDETEFEDLDFTR